MPHGLLVFALSTSIANADGKPLPALDRLRHRPPAQCNLNRVLDICDTYSVASGFLTFDLNLQIPFPHDRSGDDVPSAGDRLERRLDVFRRGRSQPGPGRIP